jgi:hypothetical protein
MSTFYLLPSRPLLGDRIAGFLHPLLPGLDWDCDTRVNLVEAVVAAAQIHDGVYVVHREDLPADVPLPQALADGFGAEPGDEVVEIRPGRQAGELTSKRWKVA